MGNSPSSPDHVPVMGNSVVSLTDPKPGDTVVDGTFGAGGHSRLLAARMHDAGLMVGIDRDPSAAARHAQFATEVAPLMTRFVQADFPTAMRQLVDEGVSAEVVILDVGVSSMQLDQPERGFAYSHDAPLDMRMDPSSGDSAADLVASADVQQLTDWLRQFGEERHAYRIAKAIVRRREQQPIATTFELVDTIRSALPAGGRASKGGHPAKRTFQALRIAVNDELGMLDRGLDAAFDLLAPEGRLAVMAFHSLEDRMVKQRFAAWVGACSCPQGLPVCVCGEMSQAELLTRGAARPDAEELAANPRSASTKLRVIRKRAQPIPIVEVR